MKVHGHRGYSSIYPENTMLAFRKACEYHADLIETDIHKTKDGILVLCHDEKIDRTSNGKGYIKDMTYEELCQYDFKYNKNTTEFNRIPKLEELLQLAKEKKMGLNLEIKTDNYQYPNIEEDALNLVKQYGLLETTMFSSFNFDSLLKLKELDSSVQVGYLFEVDFDKKLDLALKHGIKQIHPKYTLLTEKNLKKCIKRGIMVNAWTINKEIDMEHFRDLGLDGCITNFVELGLEIAYAPR